MEETEPVKKRIGWPKGKKRGPRNATVAPTSLTFGVDSVTTFYKEPEAPIHVRVTRKGMEPFEFGCAQHFTENGFHVFLYPSRRDPYRQTRREIAISEVIDIEITEARRQEFTIGRPVSAPTFTEIEPVSQVPRGPIIHTARKTATSTLERLATSEGPIKMDTPPGLTFGNSAG